MSTNPVDAEAMFLGGFNCAQSVLACCGRRYGLDRSTAIRVAQGFGGGIGRTGSVCGALTGAIMVIGLKHAALEPADAAAKARAYQAAQAILEEFRRRNGTVACRDLTGCDLTTPEGQRQFKERDLHRTLCARLVREAAEIVETRLEEESAT